MGLQSLQTMQILSTHQTYRMKKVHLEYMALCDSLAVDVKVTNNHCKVQIRGGNIFSCFY